MKPHDALHDSLQENLSGIVIPQQRHREILNHCIGGKPMKKKLTAGLVLALVCILITVTAFAAYLLLWSPQADAVSRARQALADTYGLTPETMGCFLTDTQQSGNTWTVTFTGEGLSPGLLGSYTVVVTENSAKASWSHDDVDPALWQSGGLSAPVWGQPQIAEALRNPEEANAAQAALVPADQPVPTPRATPPGGPESFQDGTGYWNGEFIYEAEPGDNALSKAQAWEIACQALIEEFGLTRAELDAGDVVEAAFYTRESGGTLWGFDIHIMKDGLCWGCGVMMDGQTGELLMVNVMTGGNG